MNLRILCGSLVYFLIMANEVWSEQDCADSPKCSCNVGTGGNLIVDCSRQDMKEMPGMPTTAYDLRLERNEIKEIPEGYFDNLTELTYLKLNNNKISAIPSELFDKAVNLVEVNFNNNLLTKIPDGLFAKMTKLKWLYLEDNPFDCGCDVEEFREWLLAIQSTIIVDAYCDGGNPKIVDIPLANFDKCIETTTSTTTTTTTTTTTSTTTTTTTPAPTTTRTTTTATTTEEATTAADPVHVTEESAIVAFLISLSLLVVIILTCIGVLYMNWKQKNNKKVYPENDDELEKSDELGGLPEKNDTPEYDPPEIDDNPDNNDQQDYNSDAKNQDWQRY